MAAERDTVDRLIASWLAERVGADFEGRIRGVTRAGLFVELDGERRRRLRADLDDRRGLLRVPGGAPSAGRPHDRRDVSARRRGQVRLVEALPYAGSLRLELLRDAPKAGSQAQTLRAGTPLTSTGKPKAEPPPPSLIRLAGPKGLPGSWASAFLWVELKISPVAAPIVQAMLRRNDPRIEETQTWNSPIAFQAGIPRYLGLHIDRLLARIISGRQVVGPRRRVRVPDRPRSWPPRNHRFRRMPPHTIAHIRRHGRARRPEWW